MENEVKNPADMDADYQAFLNSKAKAEAKPEPKSAEETEADFRKELGEKLVETEKMCREHGLSIVDIIVHTARNAYGINVRPGGKKPSVNADQEAMISAISRMVLEQLKQLPAPAAK